MHINRHSETSHVHVLQTQSQLTNEFQLLVETGLLEGTTGGDICLATNPTPGNGHGGLVPATMRQNMLDSTKLLETHFSDIQNGATLL